MVLFCDISGVDAEPSVAFVAYAEIDLKLLKSKKRRQGSEKLNSFGSWITRSLSNI